MFRQLPTDSGVYRIRIVEEPYLAYIGQTGRNLRERVRTLALRTLDTLMPFNDPHTAAPNLWAWHDAKGYQFECSVASTHLSDAERQILECYLLWQYRLEKGESTLCNHGRFHQRYRKSRNRSTGDRGGSLPMGEVNPAGGPSMVPLPMHGKPVDRDWMKLEWSESKPLTRTHIRAFSKGMGLYKVLSNDRIATHYIGQSTNLQNRLMSHALRDWPADPLFACSLITTPVPDYQLHEWENDLIGFFWQNDPALMFQFSRH